ncbi:MAG: NAD(P)/FAD-dependent oxidoreductase [Armatimonadota bacterium]
MSPSLRRDVVAGAAAGFIGGLVFSWAQQAQGLRAATSGLVGVTSLGAGVALDLVISIFIGATFGAIFRYQSLGYAPTISSGVLYGLLWWMIGPLTLVPALTGNGPTWSLQEANAALPSLVGHVLYGALTGLSYYMLVTLYLRARPAAARDPVETAEAATTRVVILGGGFGGVSAAQRLEQLFSRDVRFEITLVSQSNYLLFTPMLAEVASSGLEPQHISAPVRAALPHTRFRRADVETIDIAARVVQIRTSPTAPAEALPYDHLVLALGSVPNFYGLPGLEDNSFTLKTLQDATALRNHVIGALERADVEPNAEERRRMLTFVVAGGGFAGTEMIAELFDLVQSVLHYFPQIPPGEARFVLVHSGARILPEISAGLADYALRKLRARGIEFLLNTRVGGATTGGVLLADGAQVPTRTLVWTAGNQPHPLLKALPCERNRAGAVIVSDTLQVTGVPKVWAVGDCAQVPDIYNQGQPCPPTAQHALREGKMVAENIAAVQRGAPPARFRFRAVGILVALGHRTAVAEIRGLKFSGFLAWFMWRTIYLSKLPGLEKKVRVALDWTIDLFFPRDIALTDQASTPTLTQTLGLSDERPGAGAAAQAATGQPAAGERVT